MTSTKPGDEVRVKIVQCGWCPVIMADDLTVILLHFTEDHRVYSGSHSIRYIQGADWDVAEITPARSFSPAPEEGADR